jgi:glycosyltransferase involved in cell wall biosynthesis
MKIAIVSYLWSHGGAARAARSLANGLAARGHSVTVYSKDIVPDEGLIDGLKARPLAKLMVRSVFPRTSNYWKHGNPLVNNTTHFSVDQRWGGLDTIIGSREYDIVNIHWFQNGFMSLNAISKLRGRAVITPHDSWLATGGCHAFPCDLYSSGCQYCPAFRNDRSRLPRNQLQKKQRFSRASRFSIISPSEYIAKMVKSSLAIDSTRVSVVPNGVDDSVFYCQNYSLLKQIWGLERRKAILFVASEGMNDPNKGFGLLDEALTLIPCAEKPLILVVGGRAGAGLMKPTSSPKGNEVVFLGKITDAILLSQLYNLAECLVVPSLRENLPFVAIESICCGTPVIAFDVGGLREVVSCNLFGRLVSPYCTNQLSVAIREMVGGGSMIRERVERASQGAAQFRLEKFISGYEQVFMKIVDAGGIDSDENSQR